MEVIDLTEDDSAVIGMDSAFDLTEDNDGSESNVMDSAIDLEDNSESNVIVVEDSVVIDLTVTDSD
jgi:hypothetical protein